MARRGRPFFAVARPTGDLGFITVYGDTVYRDRADAEAKLQILNEMGGWVWEIRELCKYDVQIGNLRVA